MSGRGFGHRPNHGEGFATPTAFQESFGGGNGGHDLLVRRQARVGCVRQVETGEQQESGQCAEQRRRRPQGGCANGEPEPSRWGTDSATDREFRLFRHSRKGYQGMEHGLAGPASLRSSRRDANSRR